jgi:chromodomain-helicase-DNA-binding protein 1
MYTDRSPASKRPSPQSDADSDSDSEDFVTNVRHRPSKKQKQYLKDVAHGRVAPSQSFQRFSERNRTTANYAEDSAGEDEFLEEDAPVEYQWEEETGPKVGQVLAFRHPDGDSVRLGRHLVKQDFEYWVRMEGEAHLRAKWVNWEEAKSYRGDKRATNYFNKIVMPILAASDLAQKEGNTELLEQLMMEYDQVVEQHLSSHHVDRVIATRAGEEGTEYYVKWKNVPYDGCTWESEETVSELTQDAIDEFLNRSQRLAVSDKKLSNQVHTKMRPIETQPSYIQGGKLRDFQLIGLNFLAMNWCRQRNVILADEMGLGKTIQTIAFMNWLVHDRKQAGPMLCIIPLSTMPAWQDAFEFWAPSLNVVTYYGGKESRQIIADYEMFVNGDKRKVKFNVLLTTYELVYGNADFFSGVQWQFCAVDEAHRLKNRETKLYTVLNACNIPNKLLITGTPMQNSIEELRALLDFLNPGEVDAPDEIENLDPEEAAKIVSVFKDKIRPYMLRRIKTEVEKDLPPKTEKIIRVDLSSIQLEYYQNIITKNFAALNTAGQKQLSLLNVMMELKKVSNHPFLISGVEDRYLRRDAGKEETLRSLVTSSGKMMLLDKLLPKLKADGHRVLIFTQLVTMLDVLGDYLQMKGHQFQRLDGTVPSQARRQSIAHFNAPDSEDFAFLLSTRAGGLGINLMTADAVILFDSDWNPHLDVQAIARAHRIGQTKPVKVFRFVSSNTVEEEILERARNKLVLEYLLIQSEAGDKEKDAALKKAQAATEGPRDNDDIKEILKRRSQKMFEANDNQKKLEELDIDAVLETAEEHQTADASAIKTSDGGFDFMQAMITNVKFEGGWDQIIPAEKYAQLEAEEKAREEEEFLKKAQEEAQGRKRGAPSRLEQDKDQRSAKRKAKRKAEELAAAQQDDSDELSEVNSEDERLKDPRRPMEPKEWRHLIRACEKYGSFLDPNGQQQILKEARLSGRDINVVTTAFKEITDSCRQAIQDHEDKEAAGGKQPLTKKEKKAILLELHGVKRINCETFLERAEDMKMIREIIEQTSDFKRFRVAEATKPAHYTCEWGAREDGMLVVGMARHGFGGWAAIRDDEELGMIEKLFLEENRAEIKKERGEGATSKSPGAVHLVRRANYLLTTLRDKASEGNNRAARKALENHHRNNKKGKDRLPSSKSKPSTPADSPAINGTSYPRKLKTERPRTDSQSGVRPSIERPESRSSDGANGHRRKATEDLDTQPKRRKLSTDSTPAAKRQASEQVDKADRDRSSRKLTEAELERARKREEFRKNNPFLARDNDRRTHRIEDPPADTRRRERDHDRRSRERSRSPKRRDDPRREVRRDHNDRYQDDRRQRNAYQDERRDPIRHRDDRRTDADRYERPVSRDNHRDRDSHRSDRRDDRREDRRYDDRRRDDDRRQDDRRRDERRRDERQSPDRRRDERRSLDRRSPDRKHDERRTHKLEYRQQVDKKHSSEHSSARSRCSKHFAREKDLLPTLKTSLENAKKTDQSPEDRAKALEQMRKSLARVLDYVNKSAGHGADSSIPTADELW